jgi:hypothetical protein
LKFATLGFRVHSGWTSLIAVALEKNQPIILVRQRPHLVTTFSYTFASRFTPPKRWISLRPKRSSINYAKNHTNSLSSGKSPAKGVPKPRSKAMNSRAPRCCLLPDGRFLNFQEFSNRTPSFTPPMANFSAMRCSALAPAPICP